MEIPCGEQLAFNSRNFPSATSACFPPGKVVVLEIGNRSEQGALGCVVILQKTDRMCRL